MLIKLKTTPQGAQPVAGEEAETGKWSFRDSNIENPFLPHVSAAVNAGPIALHPQVLHPQALHPQLLHPQAAHFRHTHNSFGL